MNESLGQICIIMSSRCFAVALVVLAGIYRAVNFLPLGKAQCPMEGVERMKVSDKFVLL